MLTESYLGAFSANWFTGFWFPPDWKGNRKVSSPSSGPGLGESWLVGVGVPHTLTFALGIPFPDNLLEEVHREKSPGLEAIALTSSLRTSLSCSSHQSKEMTAAPAVVLVRNELAQVGHESKVG